jgi:hypothetical protein
VQQFFDDVAVLDSAGDLIPVTGASVTVYNNGTVVKATIYSDNVSTAKSNPFTVTDINGAFSFYAADGRYDIVVHKSPYKPVTIIDVLLDDSTGVFPFYNSAGTADTIALVLNAYLPFFDSAGATKNIALTT